MCIWKNVLSKIYLEKTHNNKFFFEKDKTFYSKSDKKEGKEKKIRNISEYLSDLKLHMRNN